MIRRGREAETMFRETPNMFRETRNSLSSAGGGAPVSSDDARSSVSTEEASPVNCMRM